MGTTKSLYVNENAVRLVAAQVILLTIIILLLHSWVLAALLAIDFFLRATANPSPLGQAARILAVILKLKNKQIFAPPKRFAATLGFIFSAAIALLFYFGQPTAAYVVGGILLFCAVLEAIFNICLDAMFLIGWWRQ